MVGGGAQVVVFTTGLGTPTGNPIAPVIKITGNARTARQMADNIDLDVSGIMDETETLDGAAERLFDEVLEVASGRQTKAETLGHREFAIHRRNPDDLSSRPSRCGSTSVDRTPSAAVAAGGHVRWVICALLFFAATINYVDRQVIGILKPTLQAQFGWSEIDYADIVFAFQLAYAVGFLIAGRMMDRLGARLGFAIAIVAVEPRGDRARRSRRPSGRPRPRVLGARRADLLGLGRRIHGRALRARSRRGGELPGGDQGHRRVVSEARARAGDRHLQLRHERRRARRRRWSCRGSR